MNIQFDKIGTKNFFEWLANKILEITLPKIKEILDAQNQDEEMLSRKEVAERIFKCDVTTFDSNYRYAPGFPKLIVGNREQYPKKLVEKWIHENTTF